MGKNTACIFVQNDNIDEVRSKIPAIVMPAFTDEHFNLMNDIKEKVRATPGLGEGMDSLLDSIERTMGGRSTFVLFPYSGWTGILNEKIEYESVEVFAMDLSKAMEEPVIVSASFDSDIYMLLVIWQGRLIAECRYGDIDDYDEIVVEVDDEAVMECLGIENLSMSVSEAFGQGDADDIISFVEDVIGLPIDINYSYIEPVLTENGIGFEKFVR